MGINYKNIARNISDYIVRCTFFELPKLDFIVGRISEDEFRELLNSSFLFQKYGTEEIISELRDIEGNPEKMKIVCTSILRLVISFEQMLESCPDLLKVIDDINVEGTSEKVKKHLRYMKEMINPDEYGLKKI